jgi:hypothetical protein
MTTAAPTVHTRIASSLLVVVVLVSGCAAQRAFVFQEQDQDRAQLARDEAECTAQAKETSGYTEAMGKGLGTTLNSSAAGAVVGALAGALVGVGGAAGLPTGDPGTVGLVIGGSIGAGAVIGWFVGTGLGVKASARRAQDLVDDAFQRCMERRGYKIGRDRS